MHRRLGGAAAALALLLAGCGGSEDVAQIPVDPTPTTSAPTSAAPSPSPSPSPSTEKEKALAQYKRYYKVEASVYNAPAAERSELVQDLLAEPLRTGVLKGAEKQDRLGRGSFGSTVPRARVAFLLDGKASLVDCADSSKAGQFDKKTGRKVIVGRARNPIFADMVRGRDGIWRISMLTYPDGASC